MLWVKLIYFRKVLKVIKAKNFPQFYKYVEYLKYHLDAIDFPLETTYEILLNNIYLINSFYLLNPIDNIYKLLKIR